jgi:cell division septation protein DedD
LPAASAPAQASSKAVSAPVIAASKEAQLPQPAAEINAKSTASAPAQTEEVYVNAGLFADPDNAHRTVARLIAVGLPATAQELQTSHGARTRVRVGPFANRGRAELAVRHIKAMNLDAVLAKP